MDIGLHFEPDVIAEAEVYLDDSEAEELQEVLNGILQKLSEEGDNPQVNATDLATIAFLAGRSYQANTVKESISEPMNVTISQQAANRLLKLLLSEEG